MKGAGQRIRPSERTKGEGPYERSCSALLLPEVTREGPKSHMLTDSLLQKTT